MLGDQPRQRLYPVSEAFFVVDGPDDPRLQFVREGGEVVAIEMVYSDGYRSLATRR